MPEPKEKMMDSNPEPEKRAQGFFLSERPTQTVEISKDLRDWYRSECQKERIEILSQGFSPVELDGILWDLESDGLFAYALAGNILRSRRKQRASRN